MLERIDTVIAKGEGGKLDCPTPWASSASTGFLSKPEETPRNVLEAAFDVVRMHSTRGETLSFGARARARLSSGGRSSRAALQC